jgi:2-pyrone-4,6-dicarboxylate lactonase
MSEVPHISQPLRALETLSAPSFQVPAGAWDTHVHIFGPAEKYAHVPQPHYTLPDGNMEQWLRVMPTLHLKRFVIVQPSFYGTDNSCLLDSLSAVGDLARGVVMVETNIADDELLRLHKYGVRAVRLDLFKRAKDPMSSIEDYIRHMASRVKPLGWHLQFYAPGYVVRDLNVFLRSLQIDFVIDHMGYMLEEDGLKSSDFSALLDLLDCGKCYLKLSAAYRIAKNRSYKFVEPVAKAIVERAPDRAIWGSDWPHISNSERDTGELLNLLEQWAPTDLARRLVLVENPNRLFGVTPSS